MADERDKGDKGGGAREPDEVSLAPTADSLEAITRAEIDVQVATAKRYPRSVTQFDRDVRAMALLTPEIAASCYYALPRDGKSIEGPSVRFAEIVASGWTNLYYGGRIVGEGDRSITCQGAAFDVQRNVKAVIEVRRGILDRNRRRYKEDMVGVTANAGISIAVRNAVFRVVPRALWEPIYLECKKVARGDERTLGVRRTAAFEHFEREHGIKKDRLLAKLSAEATARNAALGIPPVNKRGIEDVDLDDLELLTGLKNAIKDGDTTISVEFPDAVPAAMAGPKAEPAKDAGAALADELRAKAEGAKPAKPEDAKPAETATPLPPDENASEAGVAGGPPPEREPGDDGDDPPAETQTEPQTEPCLPQCEGKKKCHLGWPDGSCYRAPAGTKWPPKKEKK